MSDFTTAKKKKERKEKLQPDDGILIWPCEADWLALGGRKHPPLFVGVADQDEETIRALAEENGFEWFHTYIIATHHIMLSDGTQYPATPAYRQAMLPILRRVLPRVYDYVCIT